MDDVDRAQRNIDATTEAAIKAARDACVYSDEPVTECRECGGCIEPGRVKLGLPLCFACARDKERWDNLHR